MTAVIAEMGPEEPDRVASSQGGDGHLRAVLEAIPAAIYTTDAEGRITFYNQAAAELAGRDPQLGKDEWCVTWRLYQPDGTPLPHDACPMAVALRENKPVRGAEAVAEPPDGTRVPFLPFPTPLRDASGKLVGAVNMLVDISERKATEEALRASEERYRQLAESLEARVVERTRELFEANERLRAEVVERERAEAALRQAQKMEAVGQLASGIAHDFNNLLTAILGNLELVECRLGDPGLRKFIDSAVKAALRGAQLNGQLLAFSRKQQLTPQPVDVTHLIREMSEMMRRTLGGTIEVAAALQTDLWPALVDPSQLELVILNLAINARDAMPRGGTVRISAGNVNSREHGKALGLAPGDYVCIAVRDSGTGMSEQVLARACEPFFTTKEPGKGSGLGLSQVYGVARQSGGDLTIESAIGKGTTVELYLPRSFAEAGADAARLSRPASTPPSRARTVLVVDDQPDVREVAVTHLGGLGYRVIEAGDGQSALAAIDRAGGQVDLLIADYAMAGMNGVDLAGAARTKCPDLPVLITTGYLEVNGIERQIPGAKLLKKPYRFAEFAASVTQALREGEGDGPAANVVPLRRA